MHGQRTPPVFANFFTHQIPTDKTSWFKTLLLQLHRLLTLGSSLQNCYSKLTIVHQKLMKKLE